MKKSRNKKKEEKKKKERIFIYHLMLVQRAMLSSAQTESETKAQYLLVLACSRSCKAIYINS